MPYRFETTRHGAVAVLTFDDPDAKLNVISPEVFAGLKDQLQTLASDTAVKGIVLASAKPHCFFAGADLKVMREVMAAADARARGEALSREGQAFMAFVEDLTTPVLAAISGVCLGGGTELALACAYRIAAVEDATGPGAKIALPEVQLGILPGWGGSVRLPERIGVPAALDVMMTGRNLDARRALKAGLVDETAPASILRAAAVHTMTRIVKDGDGFIMARRGRVRGFFGRAFVDHLPPVRSLVCALARSKANAATHGAYPAPLRIAETVAGHGFGGRDAAFAREARALGELIATPVARALLGVFFLTQEGKAAGPKAAARPVRRIGLVGGGLMGSGIASVFADKLLPVRMKDVSAPAVAKAVKGVADHFAGQAKRRRLTPLQARDRLDRVTGGTTYEGFRTADLVVEAVPEVLDVKRAVFAELEGIVRPDCILASNTSTLPIAQIGAGRKYRDRVIGMHFFFPATRMPLVEVIPSEATAPEVTASVVETARACGKTAIVVKDAPGFLVNRILLPYMLEAYFLLEEGEPVALVDGAALRFGMPMGPVRLTGEVGVAVAHKAGAVLLAAFGSRLEAPSFAEAMTKVPDLFVVRGRDRVPDSAKLEALARAQSRVARPHDPVEIHDRLVLALVNEAAWCLGDGIVESAGLLDLALITGIGFPPFRGGLLREADRLGLPWITQRLGQLAERNGRRFAPAPLLAEMASGNRRFYPG